MFGLLQKCILVSIQQPNKQSITLIEKYTESEVFHSNIVKVV